MRAHARKLASVLSERSVRVLDFERLADLLPVHIAEPVLSELRQDTIDRAMRLEPEKLASMADRLRDIDRLPYVPGQEAVVGESITRPNDWSKVVNTIVADEELEREVLIGTAFQALLSELIHYHNGEEADLMAPYMVDILETDGVFEFPNRIWRRDLVREIREANN